MLAGLRVAVNDPIRGQDRDRGAGKNWLADIWGVVGELVALRVLNAITDRPVAHHPIDFDRAVDEVDLTVSAVDDGVRLEAKAHLLEPGKRWFMVNERARDRFARRGAVGYLPVLTALGGRRALAGRLITIQRLQAWGAPDRRLRDPAVGIELGALCAGYFDAELARVPAVIEPGALASAGGLAAVAATAARDLARWQERLPPLGGLRASELVDAVHSLLRRGGRMDAFDLRTPSTSTRRPPAAIRCSASA